MIKYHSKSSGSAIYPDARENHENIISDYAAESQKNLGLAEASYKFPVSNSYKQKAKRNFAKITAVVGGASGFIGSSVFLSHVRDNLNFPSSSDAYKALNPVGKWLYSIVQLNSPWYIPFIALTTVASAAAGYGIGKAVEKYALNTDDKNV